MVDKAKITLSPQELQLVCDTQLILTKRTIIDKVYAVFGELAQTFRVLLDKEASGYNGNLLEPKIMKGENYLLLPYVVLDYPRQYAKKDVLAIRTIFWWGNFFSITLHVSGQYQQQTAAHILQQLESLQQQQLYICTGNDQWQHHFEKDNYSLLKEKSNDEVAAVLLQKDFIKLAAKFPLTQWNDVPLLLKGMFIKFAALLKA